jgi:predicted secreted protein
MTILSGLAIWFLFAALSVFIVLPIGVKNSHEAGEERVPGSATGAPVDPMLARKALWVVALASAAFGLFYLNFTQGWLTIDMILGARDMDVRR